MEQPIDNQLKEMVLELSKIKIAKEEIQDETKLIEDLKFDSLELIKLVARIEKDFGFEFDDNELRFTKLGVYKNLLAYIQSNAKKAQ